MGIGMATARKYYHASHADLPAGAVLNGPVFMSRDLLDSHDWGHLLGNPHVYEVQPEGPVEKRRQKDALSEYEYIASSAKVVSKIAVLDVELTEYCDGCFAGV